MNGFDIIKPVENHPEEICCTECWQRGISWGSAGREEEIIKLLEERHRPFHNPCNNARCSVVVHTDCVTCLDGYPCLVVDEIALIKGETSE